MYPSLQPVISGQVFSEFQTFLCVGFAIGWSAWKFQIGSLFTRGRQVHLDDAFRRRRAIALSAFRSGCEVVDAPFLVEDYSLLQGVEPFASAQFIAKSGVEAFAVSPRTVSIAHFKPIGRWH